MTLRQYLVIMGIATAFSLAAFVVVLINVDPIQNGAIGLVFFYITAFFTALGLASLLIFGCYHWFSHQVLPMHRYVKCSFRDAVAFALLAVAFLYLQSKRYLQWWNIGPLIILAASVIILLILRQRQKNKRFT